MAQKRGLGKGIDALIKNNENIDNVSRETFMNINMIEPNRFQPRKRFEEDSLQELADSIKMHGVIQPLVVQKKGNMYEIIAGERRWRASRMAGLKEVPVIIKEYSDNEVFEIALIENIQREDLNPIEEALAYQRLVEEYSLKQDEIAERVAKSRTAVTNSMRLLKLDPRIQEMVVNDMISSGHARTLLSLDNSEEQFILANKIFDEKLSVRETEKLVKSMLTKEANKAKKSNTAEENKEIYKGFEDNMRSILGSKVEIQRKAKNKGKIVIDFYSSDEFERIYELITRGMEGENV